jgi:hypothetical protein
VPEFFSPENLARIYPDRRNGSSVALRANCCIQHASGPATRLTVTVKTPATSHEVRLGKIEAWLESGGRSPNEQAMKVRLRELLGS